VTAASSVRRGHGWLGYVVMAVIAVTCLAIGTVRTSGPYSVEDRINAVAKTIKCPTCQGESVADSNAPTSREIRDDIAARLTRGESPDEIRAFYVSSYGEEILLTPSGSGVSAIVWVLPVLVLVGAVAGLVIAFRRWRGPGAAAATDDDRALVESALADFDEREQES
jgi:cytochrome c-type biogenesis protein CcmH